MVRGFEIVKGYEDKDIHMPVRKTMYSAGYDIEAAEDVVVPVFRNGMAPTMVSTGIKAYYPKDEVLYLFNRSSNPKKRGLILANGVGVIDSDYYCNSNNDGHLIFTFYNFGDLDVLIKKGESIGQAIFQKYLITDDDGAIGERIGGFGSTDKD